MFHFGRSGDLLTPTNLTDLLLYEVNNGELSNVIKVGGQNSPVLATCLPGPIDVSLAQLLGKLNTFGDGWQWELVIIDVCSTFVPSIFTVEKAILIVIMDQNRVPDPLSRKLSTDGFNPILLSYTRLDELLTLITLLTAVLPCKKRL